MCNQFFITCYLLMLLFQILHIFEEIYTEVYKIKLTLKKYLLSASFVVAVNFFTLVLIILNLKIGFILGGINAFTAVLNAVIHIIVQIKIKSFMA